LFVSDCVPIDLSWYDGLDHREIGALALLLHHAGTSAWPGCLPDDDVLLCDCAGFGVQLRAWRRVRTAVLAGWRRVQHPGGPVLWAHAGLCAALARESGIDVELLAAVPVAGAAPAPTARDRAAQRDMIKKRRKRARERGAAGYVDAEGRFVRFDAASPAGGAVPPAVPGESPWMSPAASPETAGKAGFTGRAARAGEESPLGGPESPSGRGQDRAGARVEENNPSSSQAETYQTTTTSLETHARAQAGEGAREAAGANQAESGVTDGKSARQDGTAPLSGVALDQACARVYQAWLAERRTAFAGAAAPTSPKDTQYRIIAQWFAAGASESTLLDTIKLQVRTLKTPPNTIQAIYLTVGAAITKQLSLPLLHQTVGGKSLELKLRPSMLPYAQKLVGRLRDIGVLNAWFGALEVETGAAGVQLVAPNGFVRGWLLNEYARALDDVFGAQAWQVTVKGHKARGAA
jgi:hypothetical protein